MARYEWEVDCDPIPANAQGTAHLIGMRGSIEAASEADVREHCRRVMSRPGNYEARLRASGAPDWVKDDPVEIGTDGVARPGKSPRKGKSNGQVNPE